jgi:cytochrome c peroxidase
MHAGKLDTLEAVVKFYNRGGENDPAKCNGTKAKETNPIMPLGLDEDDQRYLVEFLKSLNGVVLQILPPPLPVFTYP